MSSDPKILQQVTIRSSGPASELTVRDLRRFLDHCAAIGVSDLAAVWSDHAHGQLLRLTSLTAMHAADGMCMFHAHPPGGRAQPCSDQAVCTVLVPIRDDGKVCSALGMAGEQLRVRVCEEHSRALSSRFGALPDWQLSASADPDRGRYIGLNIPADGSDPAEPADG